MEKKIGKLLSSVPFIILACLAVIGLIVFAIPSKDSEAQVGWGRSSTRSWFYSQAANTNNNVFVAGYLPAATANTESDIWGGGGEINWPAAEGVITVVSTSANDDGAPVGTGARTIVITGLDGDYEVITETVTLNGTTGVDTTDSFLRVNLVTVATSGALEENEGAITGGIGGEEVFRILAGRNATNRAVYTIPEGCAGYVTSYYASANDIETQTYTLASTSYVNDQEWAYGTNVTYTVGTGTITVTHGSIEVYLNRRGEGATKTERGPIILSSGGAYLHDFGLPVKVTEHFDIWLKVYSNGITLVSGGFALWQVCDVAGWQ
jgi:hypothetical protein